MTLEQSQGHQTYNNNVDPKESYNHAKFERSVSAFSKWENTPIISIEHVWN